MKFVGLALTVSIFLAVMCVGMRVAPGDLPSLIKSPARLSRSLFAMMVLAPLIAVLVCRTFSLHPAVIVALVTLSIAPVAPLFTQGVIQLIAPGNATYTRGLFFASIVLSVILTPLAVYAIQEMFAGGSTVHLSAMAVAQVVLGSVLLPLGIGLAIGRFWPAARTMIPVIQKVSSVLLLIPAVIIIVGAWPLMGSVVRQGTVTAIFVMTILGLAAGHLLGGPDEDDRTVLAFGTVTRHPGVAVAIASLTDQPLAPVGVLVAVLVNAVAVIPYKLWRKRRLAAALASAH